MKNYFLLILLSLGTLGYAQKKEYDKNMIGCYKGAEQNQQYEGVSKYWVSCRLEEGKSVLLFVAVSKDGNVQQTTENGTWWTDNGNVKFKSIEMMGKADNTYEFTDYKISED